MERYQETAVAFARALVAGDFRRARDMLAPGLRESLSDDGLRESLERMYRGYSDSEPTSTEFVPMDVADPWPGRLSGDLGRAYVAIMGDGFTEAVVVVVTDIEGRPMIREIEWGRP